MKIIVSISYFEFEFDDINEAVKFAETAQRTITEDSRKVSVTINFGEDEDDD